MKKLLTLLAISMALAVPTFAQESHAATETHATTATHAAEHATTATTGTTNSPAGHPSEPTAAGVTTAGGHEPDQVAHGAEKAAHKEAHPTEGHGTGHAAQDKTYFGIPGWILKTINMLLFFGVLVWLVKKPLVDSFNARRNQIQTSLAEAKTRREKSDQLANDINARLSQIQGEVDSILARAREEGERQKQELLAAAEVEAQKILASAKSEAETRMKSAREELTAYARELATERARQLVEQNVTDADRKRLFEQSVSNISEVRS